MSNSARGGSGQALTQVALTFGNEACRRDPCPANFYAGPCDLALVTVFFDTKK